MSGPNWPLRKLSGPNWPLRKLGPGDRHHDPAFPESFRQASIYAAGRLVGGLTSGLDVARDALLEVGRLDLCRHIQPYNGAHEWGTPHFMPWIELVVADVALCEKAMRIGYAAMDLSYRCAMCEHAFAVYGVNHSGDLRTVAC
jgi:hypothetical protein